MWPNVTFVDPSSVNALIAISTHEIFVKSQVQLIKLWTCLTNAFKKLQLSKQ